MISPALDAGGYEVQQQVRIGLRLGGGRHVVDYVATKADATILISVKWQQVSGTAEQKVPFEAICLCDALRTNPRFARAYLVLGGSGWRLRDFYVGDGLGRL
jgi:hypothetical protein